MKLTAKDQEVIEGVLAKLGKYKHSHGSRAAIISFAELERLASKEERAFLKKLLSLDPKKFGFRGEHLGIKPVPKDLVRMTGLKYTFKGKTKRITPQYMPPQVKRAIGDMNKTMQKEISKRVVVESAYRSPAYQLLVLFYYLKMYKYDLAKTLKRVAMPGYSQHGDPKNLAVDFITMDGVPDDEDKKKFEHTKEYKWLKTHAYRFGFTESYPKNNRFGVMYEPWHWRYMGD